MTIYYCDRCGRKLEDNDTIHVPENRIVLVLVNLTGLVNVPGDFCRPCVTKIHEFFVDKQPMPNDTPL